MQLLGVLDMRTIWVQHLLDTIDCFWDSHYNEYKELEIPLLYFNKSIFNMLYNLFCLKLIDCVEIMGLFVLCKNNDKVVVLFFFFEIQRWESCSSFITRLTGERIRLLKYVWCGCRGGQWNSGGKCHKETEPIFNEKFLTKYPPKMKVLEDIFREMKTPLIYLNISRLTDYRKDGHPSIYRRPYKTVEEQIAAVQSQDCSHWCLPGVPDTWNELLYASLLQAGKGSWRS